MPFGLRNVPLFYLYMMGNFEKDWDDLFFEVMNSHATKGNLIANKKVHITNGDIYSGSEKLYSGINSIIDNVLIWSINTVSILV